MSREPLPQLVRRAWAEHGTQAIDCLALFRVYCGAPMPRVPGMDTVLRLAVRLDCGHNVETAAAREYLYRWRLALQSPLFGVPHALGM